jgi:uncharacterized protein (DUF1800 family)
MNKKISLSICCLLLGSLMTTSEATAADLKVIHLLNRISFGLRPGDAEQVEKLGIEAYIQQQLNPESIPQPTVTEELAQFKTLRLNPMELMAQLDTMPKTTTEPMRKAQRQLQNEVLNESIQARLLQSTESPRQLQEVMVDFWYNHFNVFSRKGFNEILVGAYEQQAIRGHSMGRFRDLLGATAHHPAMLYYLDNWQSTVTKSTAMPNGKRNKGLNENYARELMELHTLGVNSGYTQQDVITLAKIFTGWTFQRSPKPGVEPNGFFFNEKQHDFSDKVFLGKTIKGSGLAEGEQALDILAKSPITARHISTQLAQYFVADQPPKALVDRLTQKYMDTDGNIRELLSALFRSPEFWDKQHYNTKFKNPYQYVISVVRSTGVTVPDYRSIGRILKDAGMPVYGQISPDGYKNTVDAWLNPDALTRRISFATNFSSGRLAPSQQPIDPLPLSNTLRGLFSAQTQQTIDSNPTHLRSALMLGSPEFMYR